MALKRTIPGLIKPTDQEAQFVNVKKEISFHPVNGGTVILRVIRGKFKRMFFSKTGKFTEDYHLPAERVFVYPNGTESAILNNSGMFICGVRNECHADLMNDYHLALAAITDIVDERDKYKAEKEELAERLNTIQKQMAMMK